jgi:alpha-glucosidase
VVVRDPGPGFEPGVVERYAVRWSGGEVVVEDAAGARVEGAVVRGSGGGAVRPAAVRPGQA